MTRVKVCGITNAEDALAAVDAGADALGFIFYPKSKRFVTPEKAGEITAQLPPFVTAVGVVVNETREAIDKIVETARLDAIQIHGDETPDDCAGHALPVIRALRVGKGFGEADVAPFAEAGVKTFLLDTEKDGYYGGTGETFDWSAATIVKAFGRVILSGGMTPENVRAGIEAVDPYAVDASSGVEREPGVKDHAKLKAFISNAKP